MDDTTYAQIVLRLHAYLARNHSVILDGPLATKDENGRRARSPRSMISLGLEYKRTSGGTEYRIRVTSNDHYVTRGFEVSAVPEHRVLASATNVLQPRSGGSVLLNLYRWRAQFSLPSCATLGSSRVAFVSDFGTSAGAGTFFVMTRRKSPMQTNSGMQ